MFLAGFLCYGRIPYAPPMMIAPMPIMIGHAIIDVLTAGQILATSAIPGFYDMMTGL